MMLSSGDGSKKMFMENNSWRRETPAYLSVKWKKIKALKKETYKRVSNDNFCCNPDHPLSSIVQMSLMEARYQASSVLFVASAYIGDEKHDEAIATPSAVGCLNAMATFDGRHKAARMEAAQRGDEVLGGSLLSPELHKRKFFSALRQHTFIRQTIR